MNQLFLQNFEVFVMRIESGLIVKSIAGHDKDRFYLVVKIEGGRAFIVDGKRRKICQ